MLYQGGVSVPFIFRWPGSIPKGTESTEPIVSVDLYPTFLAVASAPSPANYPLDGENLLPLLTSGGKVKLQRDAIFWHFPGYLGAGQNSWRTTPAGAIRTGDWKLIEFFEDNHVELYNLKEDIGEHHNLAADKPETVSELRTRLAHWRQDLKAPMPTPNKEQGKAGPARKKKAMLDDEG
jgi:arylsulfatase A-like enzyme